MGIRAFDIPKNFLSNHHLEMCFALLAFREVCDLAGAYTFANADAVRAYGRQLLNFSRAGGIIPNSRVDLIVTDGEDHAFTGAVIPGYFLVFQKFAVSAMAGLQGNALENATRIHRHLVTLSILSGYAEAIWCGRKNVRFGGDRTAIGAH